VDTSYYNISVNYSDNNGATWSAMVKITSGNTVNRQNPALTEKPNGDILILYEDGTGGFSSQICANGGTTFSTPTALVISPATVPLVIDYAVLSNAVYMWKNATQIVSDKFTYNLPPTAPTGLTCPNFDATHDQVMSWTFNDPDAGNTQSAYQVKVIRVSDSVVVKDTGKVAGIPSTYTLPLNTCVNGIQYQWQVACWDNSDAGGPFSALATFYTAAPPTVIVTTPITDGTVVSTSGITPAWSYSDPGGNAQQSYQVQLTTVADAVLWDSGQTTDAIARSRTIMYVLANLTSYKVKITAWNSRGIASLQVVRTFSMSFTVPATPTLVITPSVGHIDVAITNPTPTGSQPTAGGNDLYRREFGTIAWARIAANVSTNTTYSDYATASGQIYEYKVTALGSNQTTTDSVNVQGFMTLQGIWLHDVTNPAGSILNIPLNQKRVETWKPEVQLMQFAGRTKPVAEFGQSEDFSFKVDLSMLSSQTLWSNLRALAWLKTILCARDYRGRKVFGIIANIPESDAYYGQDVALEIIQVDYSEVV
jgi:hypothetical protein